MSQEIPLTTIQRTGIYANHKKQQWEAWRVDEITGERTLVGTCGFEKKQADWARTVWTKK